MLDRFLFLFQRVFACTFTIVLQSTEQRTSSCCTIDLSLEPDPCILIVLGSGKQQDILVPMGLSQESVFQMGPSLFQPITGQDFKVPSENRTPNYVPHLILASDWSKTLFQPIRGQDKRSHLKKGLPTQTHWYQYVLLLPRLQWNTLPVSTQQHEQQLITSWQILFSPDSLVISSMLCGYTMSFLLLVTLFIFVCGE